MDCVHNPHNDFVNQQWVEIGMQQQQQQQQQHHHHGQQPTPIHTQHHQQQQQQQQQQQHHHQHHPSHDFSTYGFVESPGFVPQEHPQFRLQQPPVPIAPNYLGLPHWGQTMIPPSTSHSQYMPAPAIAALPAPGSAAMSTTASGHSTQSTSSPRRTLTDADRRRMCIFHEENPNVKQTEIGAMFGVERSTVSKVLRQKEKYLFPDDGSRSPVKRSKGKFPDIERALAVWAKNTRKQGIALTDIMIREKAKFFATSVGISDSQFKANSAGWLEKFKQKNNLHANGRGRSESDVTGLGRMSSVLSSPRQGHSRTESTPLFKQENTGSLGSPLMRESKSQDSNQTQTESPESYMEFGGFKQMQTPGSASTTSMSSMFTDTASSYTGPASPTSPFFSSDARTDSGRPSPGYAPHARIPGVQKRPRSQTFPMALDPTYISPPASSDPLTPKLFQTVALPPALASPVLDVPHPLASPHSTPASSHTTVSGHSAPPTPMGLPSREDAYRALEVVMSFMRQHNVDFVEPDDYLLVGKLLGRFGLDESADPDNLRFPAIAP